jgi:hypothetical protein
MNTTTLTHPAVRKLTLDAQQLLVIVNRPGTRIKVLSGRVWMTEQGQTGDQFAVAGEELQLAGRGRSVVEGLGSARVQVIEAPRAWTLRLPSWLSALRREPGTVAARTVALSLALVLTIGVPEVLVRGLQQGSNEAAMAFARPVIQPG